MLIKEQQIQKYISKRNLELQAKFLYSNSLSKEELNTKSIDDIKSLQLQKPIIFFCPNENNSVQVFKVKMKMVLNKLALKKNSYFVVVNRKDLMDLKNVNTK